MEVWLRVYRMTTKLWAEALTLSRAISSLDTMSQMRWRLNDHHPKKDKELERRKVKEELSRLFFTLKLYYTTNREALVKELSTLNDDDKLRAKGIMDALDKCVSDDVERTILAAE
jgi:hypothetical protein